jgi:hypothetical protein
LEKGSIISCYKNIENHGINTRLGGYKCGTTFVSPKLKLGIGEQEINFGSSF